MLILIATIVIFTSGRVTLTTRNLFPFVSLNTMFFGNWGTGRDKHKNYSNRKWTKSLKELQNPADLEHGRIYDRITERCVPVAFSGKNYRIDKGRENMENASGILRG